MGLILLTIYLGILTFAFETSNSFLFYPLLILLVLVCFVSALVTFTKVLGQNKMYHIDDGKQKVYINFKLGGFSLKQEIKENNEQ